MTRRSPRVLTLILAESSLEVMPTALRSNPTIVRQARRRGMKPSNMLLDVSIHHQLIHGLPDHDRRGRPDIIHITLLSVLGSPLCKENLLQIYVHTRDDLVIEVDPSARLPRVYNRFTGLISQLFESGRVPPFSDKPLMRIGKETLGSLVERLNPTSVTLFTRTGEPSTVEEIMRRLAGENRPLILIGGFPRGCISEGNAKLAQRKISIDKSMLEAWVVAGRTVYEYERSIDLPSKRIARNKG